MVNEQLLIEKCLQGDRQAQYQLYNTFAPKLMPVCRRYAKTSWDAEDILQEGFIKVFRYLADFKNNGSFEGWLRRIMVTSALNFYKRKKLHTNESELNYMPDAIVPEKEVTAKIFHDELMYLIGTLPNGYRKVFSLNTIEGYTHKEIGEILNISANTSKSQLTRARLSLQKSLFSEQFLQNFQHNTVLQSA